MNVRDFVSYIVNSPDIDTDLEQHKPQEVLIQIGNEEYTPIDVYLRGDGKLIIQCNEKRQGEENE